jgi:hypothetical protein
MFMLGYGGHALMDLYSPLHRFAVWGGVLKHPFDAAGHGTREGAIQRDSTSVAMAIWGLQAFRKTFEGAERLAPLGYDAVFGVLLGTYGQNLYLDALLLVGG